jgi:hypothetical protein
VNVCALAAPAARNVSDVLDGTTGPGVGDGDGVGVGVGVGVASGGGFAVLPPPVHASGTTERRRKTAIPARRDASL